MRKIISLLVASFQRQKLRVISLIKSFVKEKIRPLIRRIQGQRQRALLFIESFINEKINLLIRKFRRRKLSSLIKKEMGKYGHFQKPYFLQESCLPSLKSILLASLFTVFFGALSSLKYEGTFYWIPFSLEKSEAIGNYLIAIHSGVGIIIFALLIFVAESFRDGKSHDRARVLLRESMLFPLTVLEIMVFFIFILNEVNCFAIFPVAFVGILTISSVYKLLYVLLNKTRFEQKRRQFMRELLRQEIFLAIKKRFGDNGLFEQIKSYKNTGYGLFGFRRKIGGAFLSKKSGTIIDFDLDALKGISEYIKKIARFQNIQEPSFNDDILSNKNKSTDKEIIKLCISKLLQEKVCPTDILCYVDDTISLDSSQIKKIESLVDRAFIVDKVPGFADEVKNLFSSTKDQMVTAIVSGHTGKMNELIEIYMELSEEFLNCLSLYKGEYSLEQAKKEMQSIMGGWKEVDWIKEDVREIFIKAIDSEDMQVAQSIIHLPFLIARMALNSHDQYLFQTFIGFSRLLYNRAMYCKNEEFKQNILELSWRKLAELANYSIEPKFQSYADDITDKERDVFKGFAIYLFIVFQGLLKDSFERKDLESFNLYKKTVVELFDHLGVGIKPEDVKKEINERRAQMFLHLASWLMHQIELSDDNNVYRAFYETIDLENSKNIKIFDEIFWQTYNSETGGFWGWSSWGLEADGKVHEIDLHGRLERYYIVKLLFFLSKMTSQEISNFKLQPHRHFKYLLDNDGAFTIFINSLEGNLGKWNSFIDEGMKDRVDILKEKLKLVRNEYVEKELQNKRKAKISSGKKDKFKREVLLSLKETPSIRGVLGYYDLISHKAEFRIEEKRFGLNTAFDKEAFLDKTGVSYGTWGKGYGKTLAMGETSFVLNKIEEKCGSVENIDKMESIISNSDNWIILSTDYDYLMRLNEMDNVSSKWHDRDFQELSKEHEGYYHLNGKEIPIFYLPRKDNKKQVFVLNMKKFGELCFYNPLNKNEDKELVEDWLYISIQAYSQDKDLLDSSLEKPTDWLSNKGSKDEQRNHLLELVLINILEKIEYIPSSDFEGFLLNV